MNSKFYLHKGKNKKAENGRPWIMQLVEENT